jgi:hypothetical protein
VARAAAARGYLVVLMDMPAYGANERLPATFPDNAAMEKCGGLPRRFGPHEGFACYDHPLQYFITPVVATVSWLTDEGYDVAVGGLSGGGWTTVVSAAVDRRIRMSFPVAGTAPGLDEGCSPDHVTEACSVFDLEQRELFRVVEDYDEIYVMGASGRGRAQLAIYNLNDPCCYAVSSTDWVDSVQAALRSVGDGGQYFARIDPRNPTHSVSRTALGWLLTTLDTR